MKFIKWHLGSQGRDLPLHQRRWPPRSKRGRGKANRTSTVLPPSFSRSNDNTSLFHNTTLWHGRRSCFRSKHIKFQFQLGHTNEATRDDRVASWTVPVWLPKCSAASGLWLLPGGQPLHAPLRDVALLWSQWNYGNINHGYTYLVSAGACYIK